MKSSVTGNKEVEKQYGEIVKGLRRARDRVGTLIGAKAGSAFPSSSLKYKTPPKGRSNLWHLRLHTAYKQLDDLTKQAIKDRGKAMTVAPKNAMTVTNNHDITGLFGKAAEMKRRATKRKVKKASQKAGAEPVNRRR
jgi:hypothetical protein